MRQLIKKKEYQYFSTFNIKWIEYWLEMRNAFINFKFLIQNKNYNGSDRYSLAIISSITERQFGYFWYSRFLYKQISKGADWVGSIQFSSDLLLQAIGGNRFNDKMKEAIGLERFSQIKKEELNGTEFWKKTSKIILSNKIFLKSKWMGESNLIQI